MGDTAMVDTVARDPLMLKPKLGTVTSVTDTVPDTVFLDTELDTLDMEVTDSDMPVVMEVMVDTPVDTVMVDTAVDTVMVDTDGKHFQADSPKKPFYTKFCHFYYCRNE